MTRVTQTLAESTGTKPASGRLSTSTLMSYGLAEMPVYLSTVPILIFVPILYSTKFGLDIAAIGAVLMASRLLDVVTDPVIGWLSDRTRTRFGRRKPWIAAGTPLLMLGVYKVFLPSGDVTHWSMFLWLSLLWLGWTMINIPYYSWGAELSDDYVERTRVTGWRTGFGLVGNMSSVLLPTGAIFVFGFGHSAGEALQIAGTLAIFLLPLCIGLSLRRVPDTPPRVPAAIPILKGLRIMWGNGPFKRLLFAFMLTGTASSIQTPTFMYFVQDVIEQPEWATPVIAFHFVVNIVALPFWVWLASKIDKHKTWMMAVGLMIGALPCYMLLGSGDIGWLALILLVVGIAIGNFGAVSTSMKADVIDLDALRSGEDRAGVFFAIWSLGTKFIAAFGAFIALGLLSLSGYTSQGDNTPQALIGLRATYSLLPVVFYIAALLLLIRYPITAEAHAKLRNERLRSRSADDLGVRVEDLQH